MDKKGRVFIPREYRKSKVYRIVDRGNVLELVPLVPFGELRGRYALKKTVEELEEIVEERMLRGERDL